MLKNKLRLFITGARGFIGKNLVDYLNGVCSHKYLLFYPYHAELELLDTEKVANFITANKIDLIIHCASVGGRRKNGYDANGPDIVYENLRMFFNLLSSMKAGTRMIFLGSGAEYDCRHYLPRMKEDYFGRHIPVDAYGFSKYLCSKYAENYRNIINLRLFGVFGQYEDCEYRFIANAIVKNLLGLPIIINQNIYFDYLYINDLVKIIEYFIDHNTQERYFNVTGGSTIDLLSIATEINRIADKPSRIIINNPGLNTEYSADNSRLRKEMGKIDFIPFGDAIKELYAWYKENIDKVDIDAVRKDEYIKYCKIKL